MQRMNVGAVALIGLVAAACFSDDPADADVNGPDVRGDTLVEIRVVDNAFSPANVTVNRGTRVRWISSTSTFHTVTPEGHSAWQRRAFATNAPNDTFEVVLQTVGALPYFCEPHRSIGMIGSITVE
jgi:plastocyanin